MPAACDLYVANSEINAELFVKLEFTVELQLLNIHLVVEATEGATGDLHIVNINLVNPGDLVKRFTLAELHFQNRHAACAKIAV